MTAVYTVAAIPQGDRFSDIPVPLPVKMPYTLADAEEMAKKYNENPIYKGILRNHRFSHFVPFSIEALTIEPNEYLLKAMLQSKERGEVLAKYYMEEAIRYNRIIDDWRNSA